MGTMVSLAKWWGSVTDIDHLSGENSSPGGLAPRTFLTARNFEENSSGKERSRVVLSMDPQDSQCVLLVDQRHHRRVDVEDLEVAPPPVHRDVRVVGTEQHLRAQL